MQVILQGSLRHFAAADLLSFLCRRGHKGTLDVAGPAGRTRILYENETILSAESKKAEGIDAVLEVLEWKEGTFTVLDAAELPAGRQPLALALPALFEEAKRRAEERSAGFADGAYFHIIEDPALQQRVSLTSDQFKLLFRLAAGRTFHELLAEFAVPRKELAERLKQLLEMGLIVVTEREAKAPQAASTELSAGSAAAAPQAPAAAPQAKAPDPQEEIGTMIAAPVREQDIRTVAEVPLPVFEEAERTMMQAPPADVPPMPKPPMPKPPKQATLVGSLTPDDQPDNVFPLLDAECVIGRKATREISFAVNDGSISSRHARLERAADGFYIEDLGSKNGTFVNGEKVTGKRLLVDGDLLRLGKVIMTFNVASERKASETTIPEIRVD